MNWTQEQWEAIHAENDTVLISAAAGSGKTAVLVERVVRLIREGGDISRMLIVTFTRAAAAEMRERISSALEKEEINPHLYRQRLRADTAQISTLHTFCQRVIREHFQVLGIDPLASVGDETQIKRFLLRAYEDAMEETAKEPTEEQRMLYLVYGPDEIVRMAEDMRSFLLSLPDPWGWAEEKLRDHERPLSAHPAYQLLQRECARRLAGARQHLKDCFDCLLLPGAPVRFSDTVRADEQLLEQAIEAAQKGALRGGKLAFSALPRGKKSDTLQEDPDITDQYKEARNRLKEAAQEALGLLPADETIALSDDRYARAVVRGLYQIVRSVQERYDFYKDEKNVLDYSDLEHLCVRALKNRAVREAVARSFDTIFVDEYQDVSSIQESIVQSIHQGNTLFLVGDVKQSIYAFRQADPSLFLRKYETFSDAPDAAERRILLQNNFRSAKNVLAAVNHVFSTVMHKSVMEIEYDEAAMLKPGPQAPEGPAVEVHLLEKMNPETGEPERLTAASGYEAEAVCRQIREMVGSVQISDKGVLRPVKYRDIVILIRNAAGYAAQFAQALQAHDIPVYSDADGSYYEQPEVADIMNLLRVLDNPYQDIPLLAVLRCPCFHFSELELARIRLVDNQGRIPFHQVFSEAAQQEGALGDKCREALARLDHWRMYAQVMRMDDLIRFLCDETGIYFQAGAKEEGAARQANLRLLAEKAEECHSLEDFLSRAERAQSTDDSRTAKTLSDQEDVVRIMTMHKSKGLEFPVVFLVSLCRGFRSVSQGLIKLDRELGAATSMLDPETHLMRKTLTETAVEVKLENKQLAEEARLLYVAMTRAREKLILYGSPATIAQARKRWELPAGDTVGANAECMMDWVMMSIAPALNGENGAPYEAENGAVFRVTREDVAQWEQDAQKELPPPPVFDPGPYSERIEMLMTRQMPPPRVYKLSVSAVTHQSKDQTEEVETPQTKRELSREAQDDRPRYMQDQRLTAAERGSAVHKALGLIDYAPLRQKDGLTEDRIDAALNRMREKNQLSAQEREIISAGELLRFFQSPLGQRALQSAQVRREWSFNLRRDEETVIQGVLDLCFMEDGGWVLVDYKTDRVSDMTVLLRRYQEQLGWYRQALERLTGLPVRETLLYSVQTGQSISAEEKG